MDERFIVFFDAVRPISHFGWDRAFCGAPLIGSLESRHGWFEVTPCPDCITALPEGSRHIFRAADSLEAICGALRAPDRPTTPGIDPTDPELCERCWVRDGASYRIRDSGALVPLLSPRVFNPTLIVPAPQF